MKDTYTCISSQTAYRIMSLGRTWPGKKVSMRIYLSIKQQYPHDMFMPRLF